MLADPGPLEGTGLEGVEGFGPYRVVRALAKGGMGAVFEVQHQDLGVRYALKTILAAPDTPGFELQLARFRREAELGARLTHPGILSVHSAALERDPPYLVVDLLTGGSLGDLLEERGRLSLEEVLPLALALVRALDHAHQAGVLHRDLKPENVMLDERGAPRLVDFGLALEVGRESRLTRTGTAVGTPVTMAPEQVTGERSESSATDVYGLAATIYWLLEGEPPLGSDFASITDLISSILHRTPPPLERTRPEVPGALSDLLAESLEKEPEARPSLDRWVEVLERLQGLSESDSALERLVAGTSARQRRVLLLGGTLAILAGIGAATASLLPQATAPSPTAQSVAPPSPSPSPTDWRAALAAGAHASARQDLLRATAPLPPEQVAEAAEVLASGPLDLGPGEDAAWEAFGERLEGLSEDDRSALWVLACLAANRPERARARAGRGTTGRELLRLESDRNRVEDSEVGARFEERDHQADLRSARKAFASLVAALETWNPKRVRRLPPADRALAGVVQDRLLWTISRLGFLLLYSARVHGTGTQTVQRSLSVLYRVPEGPGLGRVALGLFVACTQEKGHYPTHYPLRVRAQAREADLLADPGGRALYGSLAIRCEQDPAEALRLGLLARDQTRPVADLSRHTRWLAPRLVLRSIELEWQERPPPQSAGLLEARELMLGPKGRQSGLFVALIAWHLSRRELDRAQAVLETAEQRVENSVDYKEGLRLARSELELARDPAGGAKSVLARHRLRRGLYLEEVGLLAHAKALQGLDPAPELRELQRRQSQGFRRVGFPWHAFDLPGLLEGRTWWPGLPR